MQMYYHEDETFSTYIYIARRHIPTHDETKRVVTKQITKSYTNISLIHQRRLQKKFSSLMSGFNGLFERTKPHFSNRNLLWCGFQFIFSIPAYTNAN